MNEGIGARIAALRTARGLTQRALAADAHVSLSLLTKVETGKAPASPVLVGAVARALRVDVPRLTGQPFESASATSDAIYQPISALRRALLAYDVAVPPAVPPRPIEAIRGDVRDASRLRRDANFAKLAPVLPPLVDELTFAALTAPAGADREQAFALLAEVYYAVECLGSGVGYTDVYLQAVDRFEWAARQCGDPLMLAAARWGRAGPLMRQGAYEAGLRLLTAARAEVEGTGRSALAMTGSLHLRSALLAARDGRAGEAAEHIAEARELAGRTGESDEYDLSFGPSNASVYGVAAAVELEDGVGAIRIERDRPGPLQLPAERAGHHYIDLARAYLMDGDRWAALRCLQQARRLAPQQVRHHPMSREVVVSIASAGRSREDLTAFTGWLGLN